MQLFATELIHMVDNSQRSRYGIGMNRSAEIQHNVQTYLNYVIKTKAYFVIKIHLYIVL